MATIIGIDLGTTNSACGVYKEGEVELIPNRMGEFLTPSIVSLDGERLIIGQAAKQRLISHPDQTVAAFKRQMGTGWTRQLGNETFSATELSSFILQALKEDASNYLKEEITQAVVSVPAYFNNKQREATIQAGRLAGLEIAALINEPTAAAIAFGLHDKKDDRTFMVLDLGGGTFDISIMEYFDRILEVQATAGDNHLGGEDFTQVLMDRYLEHYKIVADTLSPHEKETLYNQMERAKKELNDNDLVHIQSPRTSTEPYAITAQEYVQNISPLLNKIKSTITQAMLDSKLEISDIDDLILVGGSSRIGLFRDLCAKLFRKIPLASIDPDLAVTIGSSIQAALKNKHEELADVVLTDVSSYSFGVATHNPNDNDNLLFSPIIERNTVIPVSRVQNYTPIHKEQTKLTFKIYQGENRLVNDNLPLGSLEVSIPQGEEGKLGADVRFSYDSNGVLDIDVEVIATGKKYNKIILSGDSKLSDAQIETTLTKLAKFKQHPRDNEANIALIATANKLYTYATGELREQIQYNTQWFEGALETQDRKKIQSAYDEFALFLAQVQEALNVFE
jgi:molecular chaperone HscC